MSKKQTHLIDENEITFEIISESDVGALSASRIMLRDRFGGFLHIEATQISQASEVFVLNKDCPPPHNYFLHYGVILLNSFAVGSIHPRRTYSYMLIHALKYGDKLKYQAFFTNNLESAKSKAMVIDGFVWTTKFKPTSINTSAFKWLEVLKKYIGGKLPSKSNEMAISFIKAGKEFFAVVNDRNPDRYSKNIEQAIFDTFEELRISPSSPVFSDQSFSEFMQKFVARAAAYSDSESA